MSEATKQDIHEVHQRIDKLVETTTLIRISVGVIEAAIPDKIELPERPCFQFSEHIAEHKDNVKTWKHSAIKNTVDIVKMAIVAAVVYLFATHNKK